MNMKYCLNCKKEIPNRNKYCSLNCQKEYEYKIFIEEWKNDNKDGMRGSYQISMHIKEYLFNKYNNKCARCGWGKRIHIRVMFH